MSEYIEREALIQQMADNFRQGVWDGCDCGEHQIAETTILCAPAADVVEVVRCKDCKWYHKNEGWCDEHSSFIDDRGVKCHPWESCNWRMFDEDDFCSYGERRNDGITNDLPVL